MPNAVGSFEAKFWHKKWRKIKSQIVLDKKHIDLIAGSLLGDGTMRIGKKAKNANLKIEHGLSQRDYVFWKYKILRSLVFTPPKLSYRYTEKRKRYKKSWWFRTIRHPLLTEFYFKFYKGARRRTGGKKIPQDIKDYLNPFVMAVWVMDDGSFSKGKIDLSTYSFRKKDILLVSKGIEEKFGISPSYYKDRNKGYRMYFKQKDTKKMIEIIKPFILPSMRYKLGLKTP